MADISNLETVKSTWFRHEEGDHESTGVQEQIFPQPGAKNYLITSALPYVNNTPHLGNLIGSVLSADVFSRYCRLRKYNSIYICGTDEYGTTTETKALEEGVTPHELCNKFHKIHTQVYQWFNINFDWFGRTTSESHTETCQDIFLQLVEKKCIFREQVEQWLCEQCEMFLADRFVVGQCYLCQYEDARGDQCDSCGHLMNALELKHPHCKMCLATPVQKASLHYFLDLPYLETILADWMSTVNKDWSGNARAIADSWMKEGLKARCITRDLKWGVAVPMPEVEEKVFYVWFDAPIGYITMTKEYTTDWRRWWLPDKDIQVQLVQFMAKDNVPFHSVMFPACLLGTGQPYTLVSRIFATEYLTYEGRKFSKSRAVGVFGNDACDTGIPVDVWRFYLLSIRPEGQDSNFSWRDLAVKNNTELLNNLGNFVHRTLKFTETYFLSCVPEVDLTTRDCEMIHIINTELAKYISNMEGGHLRECLSNTLSVSRAGNQYMQSEQPWVLMKQQPLMVRAASVLGFCCNIVALLSVLLEPYMPTTAQTIQQQLGLPCGSLVIPDTFTMMVKPSIKIGVPSPLFSKIKDSEIDKLVQRFGGN